MKIMVIQSGLLNVLRSKKMWLIIGTLVFTLPLVLNGLNKLFYGIGYYRGAEAVARVAQVVSWHDVQTARFNQGAAAYARGDFASALKTFQVSVDQSASGDLACKARYNGALAASNLAAVNKDQDKKSAQGYYLDGLRLLLSYCADHATYAAKYEALEVYIRQQLVQLDNSFNGSDEDVYIRNPDRGQSDAEGQALSDEKKQQLKHQIDRNQQGSGGAVQGGGAVQQDW